MCRFENKSKQLHKAIQEQKRRTTVCPQFSHTCDLSVSGSNENNGFLDHLFRTNCMPEWLSAAVRANWLEIASVPCPKLLASNYFCN